MSTDSGFGPTASRPREVPPPRKFDRIVWLICIIAAIGFAFDIFVLLMLPLIIKPAIPALSGMQGNSDWTPGGKNYLQWARILFFVPAIAGGVFGLIGGYLTDLLGRRRVLTFSILLYAGSALACGFSTSLMQLLIFRCLVFIGVCVEFVAAVAWLAELFPNPIQREKVLGYTQAFSSIGGLLISLSNQSVAAIAHLLPQIYQGNEAWRYTLITGVVPAIPLILIRPFLPESPEWQRKKDAGQLKRPSIAELFSPALRRTTIFTTLVFAASYGIAFGAIQQLPQILGAVFPRPAAPQVAGTRPVVGATTRPIASAAPTTRPIVASVPAQPIRGHVDVIKIAAAARDEARKEAIAAKKTPPEIAKAVGQAGANTSDGIVAGVQLWQEYGGLLGRFLLAVLAVRIVSRRALLRLFQIPALIVVPLLFWWISQSLDKEGSLTMIKVALFIAGVVTVSQFSFWGNYIPLVFPVHLRGTGESFAANIGGRVLGTAAAFLTLTFAASDPPNPARIALVGACVAGGYALIGAVLTHWLPEPKELIEES